MSNANLNPTRRDFLKTLGAAGAGFAAAGGLVRAADAPAKLAGAATGVLSSNYSGTRARPAGQKPVINLTTKPLEKVRVAVIGLHRGLTHVGSCLGIEFAEVVAVCDIVDDRAKVAANLCEKMSGKRPVIYSGNENIWEQMVARDDIDAVYIATPWAWHVPMCLGAMNARQTRLRRGRRRADGG